MRKTWNIAAAAAVALIAAGISAAPASAACTRLAFSVNDYGKEGPTNDAKDLLDKYIAKKMAERGVADYKTGKKTVTCELFLDVILFDEHTCKAEATVCWGGSTPGSGAADATPAEKPAAKDETAAAPADKPAAN
ncbi:MAG TPA: hypothetical protein PLD46_02000 [Hyphomicrobium sp.]|nr:hypothetical protein [Hyphomicrobium sp.]